MEKRRKLREFGLVLIIIGIMNLFMLVSTTIKSMVDGTLSEQLAAVEPDILVAVKVVLVVFVAIMALLVVADILLGVKALKISKNPNASKGYIVVAKIFLIMTCIAAISQIVSVFSGNGSAIDSGLNLANSALSICIYVLFIQAAEGVRKDVLCVAK